MATGGPYAIANDIPETESMRSAISAIGGYIQLLMSESAGPLTSMQKKFLEKSMLQPGKSVNQLRHLKKPILPLSPILLTKRWHLNRLSRKYYSNLEL